MKATVHQIVSLIIARKIEEAVADTRIEMLEQKLGEPAGDFPCGFERAGEAITMMERFGILPPEKSDEIKT